MDIHSSSPNSPRPADIFEPYMPDVSIVPDIEELFIGLRRKLLRQRSGEHQLVIVTPDRTTMVTTLAPRSRESDQVYGDSAKLLHSEKPLDISVISYTDREALAQEPMSSRCIPFLGYLLAFVYFGHRVIVFEGHPSAFEAGVRKTDVLFVDSGMLPFLQNDWFNVALQTMRPGARFFLPDRQGFHLYRIGPSKRPPGWQRSESDGEASYANCLLTTMGKGDCSSVKLVAARPVPDLAGLTQDPDELDWIYGLPFKYDKLSSVVVMQWILRLAGCERLDIAKTEGTLRSKLMLGDGSSRLITFKVLASKDADGRKVVTVTKLSAE